MKYARYAKMLSKAVRNHFISENIGEILSFPSMVTVTTTYNCNYRCRMCYQGSYDKKEIDWRVLERIEPALPFVQRLQIFGGEPLLYSRFDDVVDMGARNGVDMVTITNGSLLHDERRRRLVDSGFNNIKVSFDAGTPQTYKYVRGGNFHKVLGNIAELSKLKAQRNTPVPFVEMQMVAMRSNIHELGKLLTIASSIGVSVVNVFYLITSDESLADESLYFHQEYSDEQMRKGHEIAQRLGIMLTLPKLFSEEQQEESRTFTACPDPWKYAIVSVKGGVTPCCGGAPSMGSLAENEFMDVWNGPRYKKLRETVNTPKQPEYCNRCAGRMQDHRDITSHIRDKKLAERLSEQKDGTVCQA